MQRSSDKIRQHFDALAPDKHLWREKNSYYYETQLSVFQFLVPPGKKILELGCGTGDLLAALKPAHGVGVDLSARMIALASEKYPSFHFLEGDAEDPLTWGIKDKFDFIIMADVVGYFQDIQTALDRLHEFCDPSTRLIISYYNHLWEPVLKMAERFKLKTPTGIGNWLSPEDLENLLFLSDFETIKKERRLLVPKKIPVIYPLIEFIGCLPVVNRMCITNYLVAKPKIKSTPVLPKSVSVVIPCKNEKGNIEAAVTRMPSIGLHTEIIFVVGESVDGTHEEICRIIDKFPEKSIRCLVQDGTGKGDAVRKGFQEASGEVVMILDADLTVSPEDLPKFYDAVVLDKGDMINGCRLVYTMENEAMRFLNMLGNKFFSLFFSWLLNQRIKDTLCGTKVLLRKNYELIAANRDYFGQIDPFGDFDLLFGASRQNLKIIEIPIRYGARIYGETQIRRFYHGFILLKMCFGAIGKMKMFNFAAITKTPVISRLKAFIGSIRNHRGSR